MDFDNSIVDYTELLTKIYNSLQFTNSLLLFIIGVSGAVLVLFILYHFLKKFFYF